MCKPGSACCGSGVTSTGLGLAVVVVGGVGVVSMAAAVISDIITAVLVTLIGVAAAGSIALGVHLYRTRGMVARPAPRPAGAGRRPPLVRARIEPARARPAMGPAARAAIPARAPLAIEAPAPIHARIGMPAGSGGLAMARLAAQWPEDTGSLAPELLLGDIGSLAPEPLLQDTGGLAPEPLLQDTGGLAPGLLLPADIQLAPAAPAEKAVTTR